MPEDTPHPETPRPAVTPTRVAAIHLPELSPTPELPSPPAPACQQQPLVLSCPYFRAGRWPRLLRVARCSVVRKPCSAATYGPRTMMASQSIVRAGRDAGL